MLWLFQETGAGLTQTWAHVDSQEKALTSMSSTPLARDSWGHLHSWWICQHHEAELLSGYDQLLGKVSQNGWYLAVFVLLQFNRSAEMEVRVGREGIMLQDNHELYLRLTCFLPAQMCCCHDIEGETFLWERRTWWDWAGGICLRNAVPLRQNTFAPKTNNSGIGLDVLTALEISPWVFV